MTKRFIYALFLIIFSSKISFSNVSDTTKLIVLSLNDMHAKIDNFAKLSTIVNNIRLHETNVLLLSAGDNFTGNPIVDQYTEKGYPIVSLMNELNFCATAVGNHEFDYGQDVLKQRMKQANFLFLSANILACDTSAIVFPPYVFKTLSDGTVVGIVSFIQINDFGIPDSHPVNLKGFVFKDVLKNYSNYLWLRNYCDVLICLTHLGVETDIELASKFNGVDLIVGGHSHTLISNPIEYNGALIIQAGSGVNYLNKTTISIVNKKIINKITELININEINIEDENIAAMISKFNDNPILNASIANITSSISGKNELGSLMADALTFDSDAEMAFVNNGGIRIAELPAGEIKLKDIYRLDPFGNELIIYNLNLKEIKSLIETAYKKKNSLDLQASGVIYNIVTNDNGDIKDIELTNYEGNKLKDRNYKVGINSYIANSYSFNKTDFGISTSIITAQKLINFIKAGNNLNYKNVKRAFLNNK